MTTRTKKPRRNTLPCAGGCGEAVGPPDVTGLDPFWSERLLAMPRWCDECEARDKREGEQRRNAEHERRRAASLERRRLSSGLPRRWWDLEFDTRLRSASYLAARRWASGEAEPKGLLLWGDVGVGKTYLAATALADRLRGGTGLWTSAPTLMARLSAGFGSDQRELALGALLAADTPLVLDDLDKANAGSEHAKTHLFGAIDERVAHDTPLLVTTNLHPSELAARLGEPWGGAIASRLAGHCLTFEIGGDDRRTA